MFSLLLICLKYVTLIFCFFRYVEKVILPYIEHVKEECDLPLKQHALCIFDVFKAHQGETLRKLLHKNNVHMVYVPASCTDCLQPLDLSINATFKHHMKASFENWYASQVASLVKDGKPVDIDLRLSVVKPLQAKWLLNACQKVENDPEMIKRGWEQAGILLK